MSRDLILAVMVVLSGATGTYLLLPHAHGSRKSPTVHAVGGGFAGFALLVFALFWTPPGPWISGLFFYAFGLASVAGSVLTITSRNPIHSALWFAAVVLSTAGLFVLAGAQFLAAGTVIVYAGAIIVTFLFVIMLAQMEGKAIYDRSARMPFRATWTSFVLFLGVFWLLIHVKDPGLISPGVPVSNLFRLPRTNELVKQSNPRVRPSVTEVLTRAERTTARLTDASGRAKPHVAGLGETLYTDHLVAVELAGALLFTALIGALAIATPKPPVRPGVNPSAIVPPAHV